MISTDATAIAAPRRRAPRTPRLHSRPETVAASAPKSETHVPERNLTMKIVEYLPSRLHGGAIVQVLEALGISIPTAISASAGSREELSYAIRASRFTVDMKALDKALSENEHLGSRRNVFASICLRNRRPDLNINIGITQMFAFLENTTTAPMARRSPSSRPADAAASIRPRRLKRRARYLRDYHAALGEARQKVAAREAEVGRLEDVISEGEKIAAALRNDIAADGAVGIAAIVKGEAQPTMRWIAHRGAMLAARAATCALPVAKAALEQAKADAMRAEHQHRIAAHNVMLLRANEVAADIRLVRELAESS